MISFWPWHHISVPSLKAITYRVSLRRDRNRMLWWLEKKRSERCGLFHSNVISRKNLTMKISPGFVSKDYLLSHRPLIQNMVQCWVPPSYIQLSYKLFFHPTYLLQNHPSWRYTDDLGCLRKRVQILGASCLPTLPETSIYEWLFQWDDSISLLPGTKFKSELTPEKLPKAPIGSLCSSSSSTIFQEQTRC